MSNNLLRKILILDTLTATGREVFVSNMTKFLFYSYDNLEETINHMNSLKLKSYPGESVTYFCGVILVDVGRLESHGVFNSEHLGYITYIFEDTSDSVFRLWSILKYI